MICVLAQHHFYFLKIIMYLKAKLSKELRRGIEILLGQAVKLRIKKLNHPFDDQ